MKKFLLYTALLCFSSGLVSAQSGSALSFDGRNTPVIVATSSSLNFTSFTIETWFYWSSSGTSINFISSKGVEQMEIHTGGQYSNNIRFIPARLVYLDAGTNAITPNTWTHIACVYDPSQSIAKMYLNGTEVTLTNAGTNGLNTPLNSNASPLYLGLRADNSLQYQGKLDEFRIWNRALTASEIQSSYQCEIQATVPGLVLNYHFNQGVAASTNTGLDYVSDDSGFNNTGTLSGFALTGTVSNWVASGAAANGNTCGVPTHISTYSSSVQGINFFPNPVTNVLNITNPPKGSIKLYNAQGILVLTMDAKGQDMSLNVQEYTSGLYYLTIDNTSYKFLKE